MMTKFEANATVADELRRVRVWDLPTRLFHWALVGCAVGLFVSGKIGGEAMLWHARLGYATASLLLFRVAWGVVGGHWSRFSSFLHSPRVLLNCVRGREVDESPIGHSPLGSLSVFALLAFLITQVATGLFSADMEEFAGPLNIFVSNATARILTFYHKNIGEPVLVALVLLHVAAIAYYHLRRGQNLIGPMWHGDKRIAGPAPASRDDWLTRLLAAVMLVIAVCAVAALVTIGAN